VLARLRRTASISRFDGSGTAAAYDDVPDVSSTGPRLPFLFGLGTTMHGGNPQDGYSPRHDGMAVRATSIADSRPVVRVGPPLGQYDQGDFVDGYAVGTAPFVLFKSTWQESPFLIWKDEGDGNFSIELTYVYEKGVLAPPSDDDQFAAILQTPRLQRLGDRVYRWQGASAAAFWEESKNWEVQEAYAPVIRRKDVSGAPWSGRVVGFVRVRAQKVVVGGADGGSPDTDVHMKLWKLGNERVRVDPTAPWIAPRNASALFDGLQASAEEMAQETFLGIQQWSWEQVLAELHGRRNPENGNWLTRPLDRAIRAPALVR
jgi:hypothetical protein